MMKASELMIGDWVEAEIQVDDTGKKPVYAKLRRKVKSLEKTYIELEDKCEEGATINPIPITREILEDNGFVCVEVGDNGPGTPPKFRNRYEKWECRTQWHTFHIFIDRITSRYSMNAAHSNHIEGMQYVHELQHALRLCGIDKEIEL